MSQPTLDLLTQLTLLGLCGLGLVFIYYTFVSLIALCLTLTTNPEDTEE
jgi:hypothetical protein